MTTAPDDRTILRTPEETPTVHLDAMPSEAAIGLAPGAILGGRYRVVALLGRGGMGEVYRADDLRLDQPVALKFLNRRVGNEKLLYDEVRIGRQISHPNVCRLYDIAEASGRLFITMEYVDGEDLASLFRRIGRLAPATALTVARDLCAAVAAAHDAGIIHRDLKPGNVMIDGRGRARVTDFGLAVAAAAGQRGVAGTPAYMAPEQLAGGRATVASDLYALGLVLYEIFTGRRAIAGTTLTEIREAQLEQRYARPSVLAPEIPPAIEETILRCLDPDPDARPASVHELVRELPAFDPLQAALAAGETPSAGMVAASSRKGDLRPAVAWSLLVTTLAGVLLATALSPRATIIPHVPAKPAEVLLEKTNDVLAAAGVSAAPADRGSMYYLNQAHVDANHGRTTLRTPVDFLYRQSPRAMRPRGTYKLLKADDPPLDQSGMANVRLDSTGALTELTVVPPQRDTSPARASYDWSKLLALARLDTATLRPAQSEWAAPVDSDAKRAWTIGDSGARVEAASYRGRPVWLAVIEPWEKPARMAAPRAPVDRRVANAVQMTLLVVLPAVMLLLAWRNGQRGGSDRRGAFRLAVSFLGTAMLVSLLRVHHPSSAPEAIGLFANILADTAFFAAMLWIAYLAIEPLVRRRWPEMLIGWSRLLGGRWRDPLVGRDVLAGLAAGTGIALALRMTAIVPAWMDLVSAPLRTVATPLGGTQHVIGYLLIALGEAMFNSVFAIVLLLVVRAVVRRLDVAVVLSAAIIAAYLMAAASGPLAVRAVYGIFAGAVIYGLLLRLGLLALVSAGAMATIFADIPLTLDTTSWYFPRAALVLLVLATVACGAFYLALGGKRFLPRVAL